MDFITLDQQKVLAKFDEALGRGLCVGKGDRNGQMCIEAAICYALDLPHGDDPACVTSSVRSFKIKLNDSSRWTSPASRAKHLRNLGIAQIGSKGVVDDKLFSTILVKQVIQKLIPTLFRDLYPNKWVDLVNACEKEGSQKAARALANAAVDAAVDAAAYADAAAAVAANAAAAAAAADTANAAVDAAAYAAAAVAANAANAAAAAVDAAYAAANAKRKSHDPEKYLILAASLALDVLKELKSPGCAWLEVS